VMLCFIDLSLILCHLFLVIAIIKFTTDLVIRTTDARLF